MSDTLVFVSYRQADARGDAGLLFERLRQWFPPENLFFDLHSIEAGEMLPDRIRSALDSAKVVLAVIGPDWVREINQRAELPNIDYVRAEVEHALTRIAEGQKLLIVPVLVGGAAMPDRAELHADLTGSLAPLCEACAHTFTGNQQDLDNQFDRLFERIAQVTGVRRQFRLPAQYEVPSNDPPHQLSACFQDPDGCLERLCRHLDAQRRVAICGMAGVGKTHLALKYWHEHLKEYAGCWWFASETEAGLEDDALALCEKVGIPCDRQRESPAAALRRWLERQETSWLLVYDNAETEEALRPFLPARGPHHLLVTSRSPAWGLVKPLEIGVWTQAQGAGFLAARLGPHDGLVALASDLGGLPLALEQAAGYIGETGSSIKEYRGLLNAVDTEGLILEEGRAATGYERSVAAALSVTFARLGPAARRLLRLCAFAAPEPLPERIFLNTSDLLPAELAAAAGNPLLWNRAVGELRRYSLVERLDMPDPNCGQALRLHRLNLVIARVRLAKAEEDIPILLDLLHANARNEAGHRTGSPLTGALILHILHLSCQEWVPMGTKAAATFRLGAELAHFAGRVRDCLSLAEAAERALPGETVDTDPLRIDVQLTLLAALKATATRDALEKALGLGREAIEKLSALAGEADERVLNFKIHLADTLDRLGHPAEAAQLLREASEIQRRRNGENDGYFATLGNLANVLRNMGDLDEALGIQRDIVRIRSERLGEQAPETLTAKLNLASTYCHLRDFAQAERLERFVVERRRAQLGEEDPATLTAMSNLALTLGELAITDEAASLQTKVLEAFRARLGDRHPDTMRATRNLAATLYRLGDIAGARRLHEHMLEDSLMLFEPTHIKVSDAAYRVWEESRRLGDDSEADRIHGGHLAWMWKCADLSGPHRKLREQIDRDNRAFQKAGQGAGAEGAAG